MVFRELLFAIYAAADRLAIHRFQADKAYVVGADRRLREVRARERRVVRAADAGIFYGMKAGQEISVEIESGKTLFIRLVNIGAVESRI